jgi:hypothetical protein
MFRGLVFALGALIVGATIFGQIKGGRFPAYWDLAISLVLPFACYAILVVFTYLCCSVFPVRMGPHGIKASNLFGLPVFVRWQEIISASICEVQGIPYILLDVEGRTQTAAIPVWLRDPQGFVAAVARYAEPSNPLVRLVAADEAQPGSQQDAAR